MHFHLKQISATTKQCKGNVSINNCYFYQITVSLDKRRSGYRETFTQAGYYAASKQNTDAFVRTSEQSHYYIDNFRTFIFHGIYFNCWNYYYILRLQPRLLYRVSLLYKNNFTAVHFCSKTKFDIFYAIYCYSTLL